MAKASHVALWGGDLKVVAGVGLKVLDDGLLRPSVHLYVLMVILHLEDGGRFSEEPLGNFDADVGLGITLPKGDYNIYRRTHPFPDLNGTKGIRRLP